MLNMVMKPVVGSCPFPSLDVFSLLLKCGTSFVACQPSETLTTLSYFQISVSFAKRFLNVYFNASLGVPLDIKMLSNACFQAVKLPVLLMYLMHLTVVNI